MQKEEVLKFVEEHKIIVIARGYSEEELIPAAQALYDGGIRLLEVTFDQTDENCVVNTPALIKKLVEHFKGKMCIGAGTVLTEQQVDAAKAAGAEYIISPDINVDIIKKVCAEGLCCFPGAYTPSEITCAYRAGASFVKVFPAANGGPSYLKLLLAPLKHIPLLAVAGVDENNIAEYMQTGIKGVGVGETLLKRDLVINKKYDELKELAQKFVANSKV